MRHSTASKLSAPTASLPLSPAVLASSHPQAADALPLVRVSPAAESDADLDEDVPAAAHLSLFVSPLLAASHLSPLRPQQSRQRRSRRASVTVRDARTPGSLKLQPYPPSSPLCMLEPVSHLSLLPAEAASSPASVSASPLSGAESFLYPLSHLSSVGLTVAPPSLSWSAASRELEAATAASSVLLSAASCCQAERLQQLDRLVSVGVGQDVDALAQQSDRERQKRWDEQERASWELSAAGRRQREQAVAAHSAGSREQAAESRAVSARLAADQWRFRDEREDADRVQRESRAARQAAQSAAADRLDRRRQAESQQWQREWRLQAEASRQQRLQEREQRARRQQEDAQRVETEYEALRLKAKGARLQLRMARVELLDGRVLPAWAASFLCCQVVQQPAAAAVLDYPSPLSELQFSPFIAQADGLLDWRCELLVRSVAHASLVLSFQCCEQQQADRWQRWLAKREAKKATAEQSRDELSGRQDTADRLPAAVRTPATRQREQKRSTASSSRSARSRTAEGEGGQTAAGRRRAQGAASSRPQSHRHRLITRTLELGRLEWRLRELRDAGGGELRAMAAMSGEAWYARRERQDRKRRKSIGSSPAPQIATPRSAETEAAEPLSPQSGRGPLSPSALNPRSLLLQSPSSLFPPPHRPKRSDLQLLLMTEKERVDWVEEEERRELLRREKERRERDKFTRCIAHVWLHLRITPCDSDGRDILRQGDDQPAAGSSAAQPARADSDDDGDGGEDEGEEEEDQQVDAEVELLWREEQRRLQAESAPSPHAAESRARAERAARREQERRQREASRREGREAQAGQAAVKAKTFPLLQ